MTTCADIRRRLWAALDGELDAVEAAAVSAHLERCPECARRLEAGRELLDRVSEARDEPAPDALRARVESILRAGEPERAGWRRAWKAVPLLAAAVAALLIARPWAGGPDPVVAGAFAADHVAHAAERPSGRPFRAGEETVGEAPRLAGARMVGLSRCVVEGRVYAHWVYRVGGSTVSAFVPVDGRPAGGPAEPVATSAASVVAVESGGPGGRGGPGAVLVSTDLPPAALEGLARGG